jgi:lipoate-protein ligase A
LVPAILMHSLRLIVDPPASGAWNMSVDEALLETAANTGQATLRFYEWEVPTLSLGYFQAIGERQAHAASRDCPVVRRASGGGAILHDRELTYSIAIPQRAGSLAEASRLYDITPQTLIQTLAELGAAAARFDTTPQCLGPGGRPDDEPFLCFLRRSCTDIVIGGVKVVGSAQRRRRGAVLQHGSILLGRSRFAPEVPGIEEVTGIAIRGSEIVSRWPPLLAGVLRMPILIGSLTDEERTRAAELAAERFGSSQHAARR